MVGNRRAFPKLRREEMGMYDASGDRTAEKEEEGFDRIAAIDCDKSVLQCFIEVLLRKRVCLCSGAAFILCLPAFLKP